MEKENLLIIISIFCAAILATIAFNTGLTINNNSTNNTLNTSATVSKNVYPDKVDVFFSIETWEKSPIESQSLNSKISSKVLNDLKKFKDINIHSISYSINEHYSWNDSYTKYDRNGYITVHSIQISFSDFSIIGDVIDTIVMNGANKINSVSFGISDQKQNLLKNEILQEASKLAYEKAESIAKGLNRSLGKVVSVTENSFNYVPYVRTLDSKNSVTEILPNNVSISASVSVVFEIV